jgi:hypothetical protein
MKEWCMEHPYMTFVMFIFCCSSITSVISQLIGLFKKPDPPPTVNMKLEMPVEALEDGLDRSSFN